MLPWLESPHITAPLNGNYATVAIGDSLLAASRRLLDAIRAEIPAFAKPLAYAVHARTLGRFLREVRGVARRAGTDWRDVTLANLTYDFVVSRFGCSTVALTTADGPLLARNMDWWPEDLLARASCHLHFEAGGVRRFSSAAWPGGIGVVTGFSHRGGPAHPGANARTSSARSLRGWRRRSGGERSGPTRRTATLGLVPAWVFRVGGSAQRGLSPAHARRSASRSRSRRSGLSRPAVGAGGRGDAGDAGPEIVLKYLARYTYRVAFSNGRLRHGFNA